VLLLRILCLLLAVSLLLAACQPVIPGSAINTPFFAPNIIPNLTLATLTASSTPEPTQTATLAPSATPENLPNLSGLTISLVLLCDRSGPLAAANAARIAAVERSVAALNAAGGLYGAQVAVRFADTLGTAEGAVQAEARMLREFSDAPLVLLCDSHSEGALAEVLNEDRIPAIGPGAFAVPGEMLFGLEPPPSQALAYFLDDLVANWAARQPADAGTEIRLAVFSWPTEWAGAAGTPELLAYAESLGVQVVMHSELPAEADANVFDLIYEARDRNANVIYVNAGSFGLAQVLNAVSHLGLRSRLLLAAPGAAYDAALYDYLADPAFAQGVYLTSSWGWWAESGLGAQHASELLPEGAGDWGSLQMLGAVDLAVKALRDVTLVGGADALTRSAVTLALENQVGYAVMDGLVVIDFSDDQRWPVQMRTWQVGGAPGELILLGEYAPLPELLAVD
jgi:ABC-type branched-subunit amino acid transport system substrate-binding protein